MKKMLLLTALCFSNLCFAQKKADSVYKRIFGQYVKYYNVNDPEGLASLFRENYGHWTKEFINNQHEEWGKITTFRFIGSFKNELDVEGNVMVYFKVSCDKKANLKGNFPSNRVFNGKSVHAAAIALNDQNLIVGHALFTSSVDVDSLISKY